MATIDLGKIKQVWRGTYNNSTAYTVDDLVEYTDSGITSSYICVANSTGNAPSSSGTAHASWNYVAKGVADPIPSQSGNSGKVLKTNGSALNWESAGGWVKIAGGTASSNVTTINLDNIFSNDYHVYKVFLSWSQDDWLKCRLITASGVIDTGQAYIWTGYYSRENSDGNDRYGANAQNYGLASYFNANDNSDSVIELTFIDPFRTDNECTWTAQSACREGNAMYMDISTSINTNNASYRGISLFGNGGDTIAASNFSYIVLGAQN